MSAPPLGRVFSAVMKAYKEAVGGIGELAVLTDLCGAALVVSQGFDSSPHAPRVVVLKVALNVAARGLSYAFLMSPFR